MLIRIYLSRCPNGTRHDPLRVAGDPLRSGYQQVAATLGSYLTTHQGEIETGRRIEPLEDIVDARTVLLDLTPIGVLILAGDTLTSAYRRQLENYHYRPGACTG